MKNAAIGLIVLGVLSLVMSFAWPMISPKPPEMTEQQEEQFTQAVGDAHGARAGGGVAEETKKIINDQREARESAIRTREFGTKAFRISGIAAALAGAGLFFWAAQTED